MERILRGLIQIGSVPDAEDCLRNWNKLQEHSIDFPSVEDKSIWEYVKKYYGQMAAPPELTIVKEYFEHDENLEVVSRLEEIKGAQPFIGTNYLAIVRAEEDRQQTKSFSLLMRDAVAIAEMGRNLEKPINGKKTLKGVQDAVSYVYDKLHDFARIESGEKLEGVVSDDAEELLDEYDIVEKTDKYAGRNLFGLEPIDSVCRGHRMGELWIHAAYAGELKTTLALNYAYNNAIVYGKNIFYAILEMPYKQLRRQIYVIHSSHGKFVTEWWKEDEKNGMPPDRRYTGLDYRKVRDGELSPIDKERLRIVARDFKSTSKGKLFVWRPGDEATIMDIRRKAEMFHNKYGCDGIVIDHLGLAKPRYRSTDFVVSQNSVVRDCRMMALNFSRGRGIPILALFQMNRQGKMRAEKNEGYYDAASLSYANECLAGETLVQTQLGLVQIQQVEPGVHRVWSSSGWKGVLNRFDNGIQDTFLLKTTDGAALELTSGHLLRVLRGEYPTWVRASDLMPGDCLLSDFNNNQFPLNPPELPGLDVLRGERLTNHDGETLSVPDKLNTNLAYLMGAHAGDGVFKSSVNVVGWCGNRAETSVKHRIVSAAESVFTQHFCISESPSRPAVFDMFKQSKPLFRWFIAVGMDRKPGVPDAILHAPRNSAIAYLQGLFDTDGSVNSQGIVSVGLKCSMKRTLLHVKVMLAKLGMASTLCDGTTKLKGKTFGRTTLRIRTRSSREIFAKLIGFTEQSKQDKLMKFVRTHSKSSNAAESTSWPVGSVFERVCDRHIKEPSRKVKCAAETHRISHGALMQLIQCCKGISGDDDLDYLRQLVATCRPCLVKSVVPNGQKRVFDLEVTGDHEYSTGGVFSHNCEKSADVITWTYLDDQLRKQGKFYAGNLKNRDNPLFERMIGKIIWQSKRMRAIESGFIDMNNDLLVSASRHISQLSTEDLMI